jgi:hypothetical protein
MLMLSFLEPSAVGRMLVTKLAVHALELCTDLRLCHSGRSAPELACMWLLLLRAGQVLMSDDLEKVAAAMYDNR